LQKKVTTFVAAAQSASCHVPDTVVQRNYLSAGTAFNFSLSLTLTEEERNENMNDEQPKN